MIHNGLKEVKAITFTESEMHHCWCCTPPKRTIKLYTAENKVQFFCKASGQMMTQSFSKCFMGKLCPRYRANPNHTHENFLQGYGIWVP